MHDRQLLLNLRQINEPQIIILNRQITIKKVHKSIKLKVHNDIIFQNKYYLTMKSQSLAPLDLNTKKSKFQDQNSKQAVLLFEYKLLQIYGSLLGIYAIPNTNNFRIWNGIIFIRDGFYKDGKFKFNVIFPEDFPKSAPQLTMVSNLYHPLVDEITKAIDAKALLEQQWNFMKDNMLYTIFAKFKSMFINRNILQIQNSFNSEAAETLLEKPHKFIEKALLNVEQSIENLYINETGTSLIINHYQNNQLKIIKDKVGQLLNANGSLKQRRQILLKTVMQCP